MVKGWLMKLNFGHFLQTNALIFFKKKSRSLGLWPNLSVFAGEFFFPARPRQMRMNDGGVIN